MADSKITALTALTSVDAADVLAIVDDPGGTPVTKKVTVANLMAGGTGTFQPLDADLTAIAGLSPSNSDFMQRNSGAWANRTVAQVKTALDLVGGTSFPGSPATNDRYFRTDRGIEYFYNGTRWLSLQLFTAQSSHGADSATAERQMSVAYPEVYDHWVEEISLTYIVNSGGTALGGSHNWSFQILKAGTGGTGTSLGTHTINSGSSGVWRVETPINVSALMGSTFGAFREVITKTGTPGTFQSAVLVTYRLVG